GLERGPSFLEGVAATSAKNAWAVGTDNTTCSCNKALILHWNGGAWKVMVNTLPAPTDSTFYSVAATSAGNAWAAGDSHKTLDTMLTMKWSGAAWKRVTTGQGFSAS